MEDLTRLGLVLIGFPVTIFAAGLALGLGGRWLTRRRRPD